MSTGFPVKRADGSFGLDLGFRVSDSPVESLPGWIEAWWRENREWVREWRGAESRVVEVERLRWDAAYSKPPQLVSAEDGRAVIRLEALPAAVRWKDWLVKFVGDLCRAHPGWVFEGAVSVA
jgi:hypothetical protein